MAGSAPKGGTPGGPRRRGAARPGALLVGLAAYLLAGCAAGPGAEGAGSGVEAPGGAGRILPSVEPRSAEARWVERTLEGLTLRQEVLQLVVPWIPGDYVSTTDPGFVELAERVEEGLGGVAISIGLPHSYAAKLNELQARARVPLLVASDFESGGPGMRIAHAYALPSLLPMGGGTSFPPTMAFGAIGEERFAREYGRITAEEARAVGVQLLFAPVLDVNSNPANPVIHTRSFGADPDAVARLGAAFIEGAREGGAATTAKHFPGHGDTRTDSHVELPVVPADRARLEATELVPFRRAVEEGVDAVMTAHVALPAFLGEEAPPATLSPRILTDLLRDEMGFRGLLLTDALRMRAISEHYGGGEAAVMALEAGADVILSPADVDEAVDAVVAAVESGRIGRARLRASVRRILELKARAGLHRQRQVSLDAVDERVGTAVHRAFADTAASRSITLTRDEGGLLPLDPDRVRRVVSVTYVAGLDPVAGRVFDRRLAGAVPAVISRRVDADTPGAVYDSLLVHAAEGEAVLVSAYVSASAGPGPEALAPALRRFLDRAGQRAPTALLSFGSPYLLSAAPEVGTYLLAWGNREVSQEAAAKAVLGETPITGRLPVPLPPWYGIGDGLVREAGEVAWPGGGGQEALLAWRRDVADAARREAEAADAFDAADIRVVRADEAFRPDTPSVARSPAEADPASVGFDRAALLRVDSLILAAIADSATPGAALAVARHGRIVRMRGYGFLDWENPRTQVTPSTLYDMASLTKVVATTTAIMVLADDGRVELDTPVVRYLPWWSGGDSAKEAVTVRQLLLHRGGLPPFRRWYAEIEGEEMYREAVAALPLDYEPGSRTVYSDIGFMTLGWIVEEVTGRSLDAFVTDRVFEPLGMDDTGFLPAPSERVRIAPTEVDTIFRHRQVHGEVHDENAWAMGGVAGHAGLFSTAWDLALFAQTLLERGALEGCGGRVLLAFPCAEGAEGAVEVVAPEIARRFLRRYDATSSRALGWDTPTERSSSGQCLTGQAVGHTGFTGGSIWIDPELDLFVVLLTNRVNPTRDNSKHVPLRRTVHDLVVQALEPGALASDVRGGLPGACR